MNDLYSVAAQGDVRPILAALDSANPSDSTKTQLRSKYIQRFREKRNDLVEESANPPFVQKLLAAYQSYWRSELMKEVSLEEGKATLFSVLTQIAAKDGRSFGLISDDEFTKV